MACACGGRGRIPD
uniref:Uncharacterized protein n=1 Tax=Arundo donax TaxID=35708 RepID=A0A0A8YPX9_ARUDO